MDDPLKNISSVTVVNRETGETHTSSARDFLDALFGRHMTDDEIRVMQSQLKWTDEECELNAPPKKGKR